MARSLLRSAWRALPLAFALALGCSKTDSTSARAESSAVPPAKSATAPSPRPSSSVATRAPANVAPKPLGFQPLSSDCAEPRVLAATAPLAVLQRAEWVWPWVTQSLIAYESDFALEPTELGEGKLVALYQREVKASKGPGSAQLVARCEKPATCNDLARVLRETVPGSQAAPYCAQGPEPGAPLQLSWDDLMPPPAHVQGSNQVLSATPTDAERACIRWAVCGHHQDPARSTNAGLDCLKAPSKYQHERTCGSGPTCYDVAACAGQRTRDGPEYPLWRDPGERSERYELFWLKGQHLYSPGGGTLDPGSLYASTVSDFEIWKQRRPPGRWRVAGTRYETSDPVDMGGGVQAMQGVSGRWQLQYTTLERTYFGSEESASGTGDEIRGVPAFNNALGQGAELLFDYDGDGQREVGVYELASFHTLPPQVKLTVWTLKDGRVERYAPAAGLPAVRVEDVDDDGRPDLLLDSRGEFVGPGCTMGDELCQPSIHTSYQPDTLAHSLKNGSFSENDAVAKEFEKNQKEP